jgi:S-adenosylmethionine synthetase
MLSNNQTLLSPSSRYTVENVLKGHPDKICDQICDALLDAYLLQDPYARVAVECLGAGSTAVIAGEVGSSADIEVDRVARSVYKEIGYTGDLTVLNMIGSQSEQLARAVAHGGAGDQGIMYGFACAGPYNGLPFGLYVVNELAREIDALRTDSGLFLPDGKVQVTVRGGALESLVVSVQHQADADLARLRHVILTNAVSKVVDVDGISKIFFNNESSFVQGGFANDTGLSGRKIAVDAYGGLAPHGGGAFSGKDPSKVDRCATYMARFVAKAIVNNGLASSCLVSLAYVFGEAEPVMIEIGVDDNTKSEDLGRLIRAKFDFRPDAIAERLGLRSITYRPTATYGHFSDPGYPWEDIVSL